MNKYSICIVDDDIPIQKLKTFNGSERMDAALLELLQVTYPDDWPEENVKNLVKELLDDKSSWVVSAFKAPDAYLKALNEDNFRSEILILDWDFKPAIDMFSMLKQILEKTFVFVHIYTQDDNYAKISEKIAGKEFLEYQNRLDIRKKKEADSHKKILEIAKESYQKNFSFRLGKELRTHSFSALDDVLIQLGKLDFNKVISLLNLEITDPTLQATELIELISKKVKDELRATEQFISISSQDPKQAEVLIELIGDKIKNVLGSSGLDTSIASAIPLNAPSSPTAVPPATGGSSASSAAELEIAKKLWSYRLYYRPKDNRVRRGDVVFPVNAEGKILDYSEGYVVLTAVCDLERFWKKNKGVLTLVPIYKIAGMIPETKKKLTVGSKKSDGSKPSDSLLGSHFGLMKLPYVEIEGKLETYVFKPKALMHDHVDLPDNHSAEKPLTYKEWLKYKSLVTVSEVFLEPLIATIFHETNRPGAADLPPTITAELHEEIKGVFP